MTIDEILALPVDKAVEKLKVAQDLPDYEKELALQYNPEDHDVFDHTLRPAKSVKRSTGNLDSSGKEITETVSEDVNRIAVPFQKLIVNRAVGFLLGNPAKIKSTAENPQQKTLVEMVEKTLKDNKDQYFNRKLVRTVKSECQAAELWHLQEDPLFWKKTVTNVNSIFKLRVKLLSPSAGDKLYPFFDETGDMTGFSRGYKLKDDDGKEVEHFDTWTAQTIIERDKPGGSDWTETRIANQYQKIPVIFYPQPQAEWADVQSMIERYETKASNFGDTNDYFGAPMVKVIGNVRSLPSKSTQGKVIQMETGGKAEYMSWTQAPESEKLEFEMLEKQIYACTQTPNISFDQMKALGRDLSGFAIMLLFADAHMKVQNDIELFGEMFQRRLNLLKHICGTVINVSLAGEVDLLEIEPVFTPYLPENVKEQVEILSIARANQALISNETAMENNPLVSSVDEELKRMDADEKAQSARAQEELGGSFNLT
ncbi:MAG: phage portal protein [Methanoregula sp.]|jgi:SPP1 family phage portal protein|nr:phage portal protein [Methanoregula sp.]